MDRSHTIKTHYIKLIIQQMCVEWNSASFYVALVCFQGKLSEQH